MVAEALVEPSHEFKAFEEYVLFFADHRNAARFGVAVANPSDRAIDVSVQVSDDQGEVYSRYGRERRRERIQSVFLGRVGDDPGGSHRSGYSKGR